MSKRSWTDEELISAVALCFSYRAVLIELGLVPAGGNYEQVKWQIRNLSLSTEHFTGSRWNVGGRYRQVKVVRPLEEYLVNGSRIQSFVLKNRLFAANLKKAKCELCGWAEMSLDGRIPVELDHINGNHSDNRLGNLRILCPNCHSLQATHRGRNKKTISVKQSMS